MTMVALEKIKVTLSNIRKRGYAVNQGERKLEIAAVTDPICGPGGGGGGRAGRGRGDAALFRRQHR
jgi:DNA-binding IclR family transcriptional regulator